MLDLQPMKRKKNKSKPTQVYSSLSIAIVLFLLGLFGIVFFHAQDLTNILKERIGIIVEMDNSATEADKNSLMDMLKGQESILPESVIYISKMQGLEDINKGLSVKIEEADNPLLDVIRFNIKSAFYEEDKIASMVATLEKRPVVKNVFHEDASIHHIKKNLSRMALVLLGIGIIFIILAIVIIRNTIFLSMYADRHEIKTMQLIGAKWNFIKLPYIKTAVLVGLNAFFIALILLIAVLLLINVYVDDLWGILNFFYTGLALLIVLAVAVLIPAFVTNTAANKYLGQRVNA